MAVAVEATIEAVAVVPLVAVLTAKALMTGSQISRLKLISLLESRFLVPPPTKSVRLLAFLGPDKIFWPSCRAAPPELSGGNQRLGGAVVFEISLVQV